MKKCIIKQSTVILLILMLLSVFTACDKNKPGAEATDKTAKSAQKSSAKTSALGKYTGSSTNKLGTASIGNNESFMNNNNEESTPNQEPSYGQPTEDKSYDLDGRELVVYLWENASVLDNPPVENSETAIGQAYYKFVKEAEAKFNCKFKFEVVGPWAGYNNMIMNNFLAGIYFTDIFLCDSTFAFPTLEKRDMILPIDEYVDHNSPLWTDYPNRVKGMIYPDRVYSLGTPDLGQGMGIWYHKDMLEQAGLQDLHDYAENGNWNWGTFLDVAIKTTRDFNGDGTIDQWGLATTADLVGRLLFSGNDVLYTKKVSDDPLQINFSLNEPKALRTIEFVGELFHTYKVIPQGLWFGNYFINGKAAMMTYEAWRGYGYYKPLGLTDLAFEAPPFGPDSDGSYYKVKAGNIYAFPGDLKDPEAVINAFIYARYIWDSSREGYISNDQFQRTTLENIMYSERDMDALNRYNANSKEGTFLTNFTGLTNLVTTDILNKVIVRTNSASALVDSAMSKAQAIIDDIINN